ncbi:uncharacterized protein LOC100830449 isoform X2 [Brachypodium distachyon]|uniref:HhH-GPD domain-containing protein n=1 Tax=Brachypodium distachyon TaxID=15368 RepID=A0A2K2CN99_BRADI|nr:uncharacterized protein LOC100830449 isoform X2 [Brachypodium distachyon]PNT63490.1 hypothetical protein BRADI_4g16620v3 [Brachypodium distachyon]PNT63492.1 hypothetical protein BRADI_4g16620v3 [Brachypodium distachyon]PNT63493.1 hypothetical protein BRADI_4g16620v3 [Brachypodium distachyon]PNT63494.1 hypothetical protein BRADI_4g16620v3 [Brachypodium distachyon]|eukprot:XP_024319219.1 uncharacterized protein LOC100830449 isoform X2 [Brachypodium distachyon]
MERSGFNLQANPAENQENWTPAMSAGRGNRPLTLGDGAHSTGSQNLAPGSGAQQDAGPSIRASCSLPAGCTQVPISILVFHRRRNERGSRPRVPGDSEAAPSIQLPRSDFFSLGRASNDVASDMSNGFSCPSAQATPVSCNSEHPSMHSQPNGLDAEAPNTEIQGNDGQLPSSSSSAAAAVICDVHSKLESAIPSSTDETQGQHTKQLIELLGEGATDHNMHNYQRTPKRPRTQLKQNDPTAAFNERTLTEIAIQIASTEKVETFQSEDTPVRKAKPWRKKHRAKVIREDKSGKKQNSAVKTPEEKSLNQKAKRSYVRKKRNLSSLEKFPGPVTDQSISGETENAARSRTASVRRRLQFELGEQGAQGDQSSTGNSCQHNEKLAHAKSSLCLMTRSAAQIGHGLQADMENLPGGFVFGMTRKLNELLDEYIHLPEITPKPTQEISPATSGCLSREPAGKQESVGSTHDPDTTRMGVTIMEGNNKDLGVKYSDIDGFDMNRSATSIPETESTESQVTKVSKLAEEEHGQQHRQSDSSLTGSQDSIILRTAAEMLAFCQAGRVKKKRSVRARRNSFFPIMDVEKNNSQALTRLTQSCMEALYESSCIKFTTKKRSWKERLYSTSSIQPNMDKKNMFSSGSIFSGGSNGSKGSDGTFQQTLPQAPDNRRIKLDIYYEVPERSSEHTSTVSYMDYLQEVAARLEQLDLNTNHVHRTGIHPSLSTPSVVSFRATGGVSNSLVPYSGLPYERPLHLIKKQRPRAKVDLDYETTRVWNLLMGKAAETVDGTDVDKERFWQKERDVFQGRANSFIARMRLVQGDRHFSPWKGSVVDSVVGVFLTQNVSDHLSSSAYMALAASFPPGSVDSNCKDGITSQDNEEIISTSAVGDISMFDFFGSAARSDLEANEGFCIHQETEIDHRAHQFLDFSSIELTASARNPPEKQSQKDMSSSESVAVSKTVLQTQLSLSLGKNCAPRYFVGGVDGAAFQQLKSNFGGNSLAGNDAATNELECRRIETGAMNDNGVGEQVIPSTSVMYPFISVDNRQPDVANEPYVSSTSHKSATDSASAHPKNGVVEEKFSLLMPFDNHKTVAPTLTTPETSTDLPVELQYDKRTGSEASDLQQHESLSVTGGDGMIADTASRADESTLRSGFISHNAVPDKAAQASKPKKTRTTNKKNMENFDWDKFRRQAYDDGHMNERSFERRDSVNWEAVRCADVQRISHAIRERGMNNVLAERIQNFLKRLVRDHGSIDLEWLRDIPPDSAKDYLLSIRGLGLKSVECVRLLTLHHLAFPVDTNVGRICVRLGWVPIQPLPESLQLHLLELYPVLETIQKYLWPRLCKLDQQTLYELHYQMITFGKVFCTKSKPNCNACPMRSECKHFASAFASARLALPAPQEKSLVKSSNQFSFENGGLPTRNSTVLPQLEGSTFGRDFPANNSEPIVEEPASPREEECPETLVNDIEDYDVDTGEIPTIKLNMETFARNLENCIKESNNDLQFGDIAKALVAISTQAASIPAPKLKNVHRLRTEHYVYELPDSHSLVQQLELDQREPDDPSPYLLTIWMEDDIKEMSKASKSCCDSEVETGFCNNECHYCVPERENQSRYVRGTILVPCRTAMKGSFPLNGTYFQVNEVFADHKSSHDPIYVAREQLWNLQRRMVYFGTSVPSIFKGLTTEKVQQCFWRGILVYLTVA